VCYGKVEGIDPRTGIRFLDHINSHWIKSINNSELAIELVTGSRIQLFGSDNYNSLRGMGPLGVVFSEYQECDPTAWDVISPMLVENKGWAIFIFTPSGKNHAYDLLLQAKANPNFWYTEVRPCNETLREDGTPVISSEDLEEERKAGKSEDWINQEYYCSFEGKILGAYYSKQINDLRLTNHICNVPWDSRSPVYTAWDLGLDDSMAIHFIQRIGKETRFIDYYENTGYGFDHYAKILKEKPYNYKLHFMPHDAASRELGTGLSRQTAAENLGIRPIRVVERPSTNADVLTQIDGVRAFLSQTWWDKTLCAKSIAAIEGYKSDYNPKTGVLGNTPRHDWCSHAADALRTFVVGFEEPMKHRTSMQIHRQYIWNK
jgi:phage terminase large subunit